VGLEGSAIDMAMPFDNRELTFATRCVACDGPITGRAYTPVVAKYNEYCPTCQVAISRAKAAERQDVGVQGEGE